jgi:hypothetical protein
MCHEILTWQGERAESYTTEGNRHEHVAEQETSAAIVDMTEVRLRD